MRPRRLLQQLVSGSRCLMVQSLLLLLMLPGVGLAASAADWRCQRRILEFFLDLE